MGWGMGNLGGGGAAGGYNFNIISGSKPTLPKENDIWVNTPSRIEKYAFSAEEPTNAENGLLWFQTGPISPVGLNISKKQNISVYPLSTKIKTNGVWIAVQSQVYQGGVWKDWDIKIIPNTAVASIVHIYGSGGSCAIDSDSIAIKNTGLRDSNIGVATINTVNLTGISKVKVEVSQFAAESRNTAGCLWVEKTPKNNWDASSDGVSIKIDDPGEYEIDTTGLTGEYYIGFNIYSKFGHTGNATIVSLNAN